MSPAGDERGSSERKPRKLKRDKRPASVGKKAVFAPRSRPTEGPLAPPPAARQRFLLRELSDKDITVKRPISVTIKRERGHYYLSNDSLNVYASGGSLLEAQQEFERILKGLYLCFSDTPDEELTADAQALKEQLRAHLELP